MGKTVRGVNVCNISFDGKYKDFIQKMRETFKDDLEYSNQCRNYKILSGIQEKYRNYVANNQNDLTLIESKRIINQEYFAVLISLIFGNIESIDKFENIFENYKKDFTVMHFGDYDVEEPSEICTSHCCCGHIVHSCNTYYLTNISTGYTLLIGGDCIEKYKILSFDDLKELKTKRQFKERTKEGRCYFCGKKGKCKACKNVRVARDVFKEWKRVSLIWKNSTKIFTMRLISFQTKRLRRLLKPLIIKWRLLHIRKCLTCRKVLKTVKYNKCYTCYMDDTKNCNECGKMIPKNYDKCYGCKFKYKCKLCDSKMLTNKYENCYECNIMK